MVGSSIYAKNGVDTGHHLGYPSISNSSLVRSQFGCRFYNILYVINRHIKVRQGILRFGRQVSGFLAKNINKKNGAVFLFTSPFLFDLRVLVLIGNYQN